MEKLLRVPLLGKWTLDKIRDDLLIKNLDVVEIEGSWYEDPNTGERVDCMTAFCRKVDDDRKE